MEIRLLCGVILLACVGAKPVTVASRLTALKAKMKSRGAVGAKPTGGRQPKPGRRAVPKMAGQQARQIPKSRPITASKAGRKAKSKNPSSETRDPFQPHWHEHSAIKELLDEAYDEVGQRNADGKPRSGDIGDLVLAALNPDGLEVFDEERSIIDEEVKALREEEGLQGDDVTLHHGYLTRGQPFAFFQTVARKLSACRQKRRAAAPSSSKQRSAAPRTDL